MSDAPLLPREKEVLATILEDYIAKAQPVGSRTVSKAGGIRLSPASIRNTMSDLADKGYLGQPHTSAGRVPTEKAFRLYLDEVMRIRPLPEPLKEMMAASLGQAGLEIDTILRHASRLVSSVSRQACVVTAPRPDQARWRQIDFVLLRPGLVMGILVLQGGLVQKRLVAVGEDIAADDLVHFGNYLNHHFQNLAVSEVRARILAEMAAAERELSDLTGRALRLAMEAFDAPESPEVYLEGTLNMLAQPEFSDMGAMREVLGALQDRARLLDVLDKTIAQYRTVVILGNESHVADLSGCGLVSAPYGGAQTPVGSVSVIGPLRMDYAEVVPLVNYTAKLITAMLDKHF
ncbi:Heat-inducible transcription repressor HrcA [Fundidesulfovibrio magnetotacticus]|uniref:Heat-inducible transcription repressor HrcA n=1 Tax=Fundidesulfovibrio magnetotacticus TaxID=2730080 RepID=A0A6V8LK90_9BACT|nr:heat-inducible transcriptional repressor HrcA [Fundidesulfovibrio magnetotacticus]GFK93123.1 Heat-inducible transcription repressor HrcA [Fundidesulfovibrio magnetotacticus]